MDGIELPKLKVKLSSLEIKDLRERRKNRIKIAIFFFVILIIQVLVAIYILSLRKEHVVLVNETSIASINVLAYNKDENFINVSITTGNDQEQCAFSLENDKNKAIEFKDLQEGLCNLTVPFEPGYVFFRNKNGTVSDGLELNNYVVDYNLKEKYYLPLKYKGDLVKNVLAVGNPKIDVVTNNEAIKLEEGKYETSKSGRATVTLKNGELQSRDVELIVTDAIVAMPKEYNNKKKFLPCKVFSKEQADLLDEILEYRVQEAGEGTRAAAVAVARFITLEFPYKISYFYENGRISGQRDHNYVDGEGRYYHKGLYLHTDKIKDIKASLSGPNIWGCNVTNWEDNPYDGYIKGRKMPNGLDCSGYVSWNLLNAGFDPGDYGAGETPYPHQMTDLGDYTKLTNELIRSNKIKPGDLFNFWGHIAIVAGIDDNNFYVAESLNTFRALILKKYPKSTVNKTFKYVVLMDKYYKEDGNLTYMWY